MRVLLALGSNLGDREANLRAALAGLRDHAEVQLGACSHIYETEPLGQLNQPAFLNMAAEIWTGLPPLELLNVAKDIEGRLGRGPAERWGPRSIDIDIILWEQQTLSTERLTLPHKEFRNRAFVLAPLAEIAPDAVDPVTGKTVAELAGSQEAKGRVERHSSSTP